ncbi:MAG: F0F1 ATP synthase subunit B [Armatimonadetes bacterium]|nr:F0F1 ATP synthase subunit B [Armatimonadota bacterium]
MSNEAKNKQSTASAVSRMVVGAVAMVAGMYANHVGFFKFIEDPLMAQGIPLQLGKTVSVIGVMLILFPVIRSFFIDPLEEAITSRNSELEKTFSEAEALRAEMAAMKSDYEKRISDTEADAREKIQSQIKEAQDLRTSLMADAAKAKEQMIAQAQQEINLSKEKLMTELRTEVANLTLSATERILGENVDSAKNRKLVAEFIEKAEVPSV